ncbi:MAG: response regulator [Planctomycetes bacterium]|jgi:CheY-like chemotaxis protein|nr:response regulator [Planctomycetota bacterium]
MSKKVLIVDDDPAIVRFLTVALTENGYQAVSASDGKEGFEKAEKERPDLLLLDVMMPRRTGFTLFKQLRRDERFKDVPIIMLTAVSSVLEEQDSLSGDTMERPYDALRESLRKTIAEMKTEGEVRPEHFIEKPVDPEQVVAKIRDLIGS